MSIDLKDLKSLPIEQRIGRRIKAIRILRGMSQLELASATGMSTQTLSRLENGITDFKLSTLKEIERVLECSLILVPNEDLI